MKLTILALCTCSIAILPAQTAAPEKPASEKAAEAEKPKAETPVEEQAFKIFGILETLPEILGSIKDEASLTAASAKLEELVKKVKVEEAALLKLEVPDNDARIKLSKKMKAKMKGLDEKMTPVMMGMQKLDQAVAMKLGPMMQKFGAQMDEGDAATDKYFKTDEELKEKGK